MAISQAHPIGTIFPANTGLALRRHLPAILVAAIFLAVILLAVLNRSDSTPASSSEATAYTSYQSPIPTVHTAKPSPLHPITAHNSRVRATR